MGEPGPWDRVVSAARLRIVAPEAARPTGAMLWVHGGGWVSGSPDDDVRLCVELARRTGAYVAALDYRLAPAHPFPAAVEDCEAALRWLSEHATDLAVAPGNIAIGGASAGGNLAAATALRARDRGLTDLALQVLVCPAVAGMSTGEFQSGRDYAVGFGNDEAARQYYWDVYARTDEAKASPYAAPLLADDLHGVAPALILTAEFDPIRDEAEEYGRRLRTAGVDVTVQRFAGERHGFFSGHAVGQPGDDSAVKLVCRSLTARFGSATETGTPQAAG